MPALSCIELSREEAACLVDLVWQVLDHALEGQGLCMPPSPDYQNLHKQVACFVTLFQHGKLRGCIGSLEAREPLWQNVCKNTYASGFEDRRFFPLSPEERAGLGVEISLLSPLVEMENKGEEALMEELSPGVDGLLLEDGVRRAVFLPSVWQTLPTPELFLGALKQKGGWPADYWSQKIALKRFITRVIRG